MGLLEQRCPETRTRTGGAVAALVLIFSALEIQAASAVDATNRVVTVEHFSNWQVIQFAMRETLLQRVASTSVNYPDATLTIDFLHDCEPGRIVMNLGGDMARTFDAPLLLLAYKIPGQSQGIEAVKAVSSAGTVFFEFQALSARGLVATHGKGSLALWIPASGDGSVKRSDNIYFSLEGLAAAYKRAKSLCQDNR